MYWAIVAFVLGRGGRKPRECRSNPPISTRFLNQRAHAPRSPGGSRSGGNPHSSSSRLFNIPAPAPCHSDNPSCPLAKALPVKKRRGKRAAWCEREVGDHPGAFKSEAFIKTGGPLVGGRIEHQVGLAVLHGQALGREDE